MGRRADSLHFSGYAFTALAFEFTLILTAAASVKSCPVGRRRRDAAPGRRAAAGRAALAAKKRRHPFGPRRTRGSFATGRQYKQPARSTAAWTNGTSFAQTGRGETHHRVFRNPARQRGPAPACRAANSTTPSPCI